MTQPYHVLEFAAEQPAVDRPEQDCRPHAGHQQDQRDEDSRRDDGDPVDLILEYQGKVFCGNRISRALEGKGDRLFDLLFLSAQTVFVIIPGLFPILVYRYPGDEHRSDQDQQDHGNKDPRPQRQLPQQASGFTRKYSNYHAKVTP